MADNNKQLLTFPGYLAMPWYENRKFVINVLKAKSFSGGVETAMEEALEKAKSLQNIGDEETEADVDDIITNLEQNYDEDVKANTILTITLPLPNSFTDSQSHSWNTEKGILGAAGGAIESSGLSDLLPKAISDRLGNVGDQIVPGALTNGLSAVGSYNIGTALGSLSNQAGLRKPLVDPGYFQNYTGTEPREFNFTFDLVPQNALEAKQMINVILKLKEFSSPEMASGGVSLLAPHFFDIDISNKYISGMANLKGVVLKNITLDYGADGFMQQYPDGIPKYIKMDLTFAERKMMTAGHYRKNLFA
jgi:hypothetical protein